MLIEGIYYIMSNNLNRKIDAVMKKIKKQYIPPIQKKKTTLKEKQIKCIDQINNLRSVIGDVPVAKGIIKWFIEQRNKRITNKNKKIKIFKISKLNRR